MPTITKAMKKDALDTARASIKEIGTARTTGEANWHMGKAHGLLEFAQVWSLISVDVVTVLRAEAHKAYSARAQYLRGGAK